MLSTTIFTFCVSLLAQTLWAGPIPHREVIHPQVNVTAALQARSTFGMVGIVPAVPNDPGNSPPLTQFPPIPAANSNRSPNSMMPPTSDVQTLTIAILSTSSSIISVLAPSSAVSASSNAAVLEASSSLAATQSSIGSELGGNGDTFPLISKSVSRSTFTLNSAENSMRDTFTLGATPSSTSFVLTAPKSTPPRPGSTISITFSRLASATPPSSLVNVGVSTSYFTVMFTVTTTRHRMSTGKSMGAVPTSSPRAGNTSPSVSPVQSMQSTTSSPTLVLPNIITAMSLPPISTLTIAAPDVASQSLLPGPTLVGGGISIVPVDSPVLLGTVTNVGDTTVTKTVTQFAQTVAMMTTTVTISKN